MLDQSVYAQIARDPFGLAQAVVVVLLASAAAVAATVSTIATDTDISIGEGVARGVVVMPGVWLIQAASAFLLGSLAQDTRGEEGEERSGRKLVAAIGYSAAPGVLLALLAVHSIRDVAGALVPLWLFLSMAVAVKAALNVSFVRGVMSVVPGLLVTFLIGFIIAIARGPSDGS
jgi:hypothetical protein